MAQLLNGFNKDLPARRKKCSKRHDKKKSYCNNLREMWEVFEIKNISFITLYIFNRPDCVCHIEMQSETVRQCDFI